MFWNPFVYIMIKNMEAPETGKSLLPQAKEVQGDLEVCRTQSCPYLPEFLHPRSKISTPSYL